MVGSRRRKQWRRCCFGCCNGLGGFFFWLNTSRGSALWCVVYKRPLSLIILAIVVVETGDGRDLMVSMTVVDVVVVL